MIAVCGLHVAVVDEADSVLIEIVSDPFLVFFWVGMMPNLCLAAEKSSSATDIGRVMGIFLFGYLVMKFANRRKP